MERSRLWHPPTAAFSPRYRSSQAPKPSTEIIFLCSYENYGKTFLDVSTPRKHAQVHNEEQYTCNEPNYWKQSYQRKRKSIHILPVESSLGLMLVALEGNVPVDTSYIFCAVPVYLIISGCNFLSICVLLFGLHQICV